ncbi:hypothetical protein CY35_05G000500 [Sphagnum magellanicum]|nr:hypothetical protein CY35_05G000500 [Sphagnum magellanicum]
MLEALHVSYAKTRWPGLGDFVSETPNLKELQFKGIPLCLDFRTIRQRFTRLNHLAIPLDHEAMKGNIDKVLLSQSNHTYLIEIVVLVELESIRALNDKFCHGIEAFLKVCPSLKRLVVWANTQQAQGALGEGNFNSIGGFINSFVKLVRDHKFSKIDIQYEDIKGSK